MKKYLFFLVCCLWSITYLYSQTVPTVSTVSISDISTNSATSGGNVTDNGGSAVTERGVCYNTKGSPTIDDNKTSDGTDLGTFTCSLTSLSAGITYYVCAYAVNENGPGYGTVVSFSTSSNTISTGTISGTPLYAGASISVPFTFTGTFDADNVFIAELSDASGDFSSPVIIGELYSSSEGSIDAVIPNSIPAGIGYRIRVTSYPQTSDDIANTTDITINDIYIIAGEYFFDTDPGFGNGTAITFTATDDYSSATISANLPGGFKAGFHTLTVRMINREGIWSQNETKTFYVSPPEQKTDLVAYEYFIDTDPGFSQGTYTSIESTSGLTTTGSITLTDNYKAGFHTLTSRFKNEDGTWSQNETKTFYVSPPEQKTDLVAYEYFIDTDPGFSQGTYTSIESISGLTTTGSITLTDNYKAGFHTLTARFKNESGTWSQNETKTFYVSPPEQKTDLIAYEYFIDNDPGFSQGTYTSIESTSGLTTMGSITLTENIKAGFHTLTSRFKNEDGTWSQNETKTFYLSPPTADNKIVEWEYFYNNNDLGQGSATTFSVTPTDDAKLFKAVDVDGLSTGTNQITLRFKNQSGTWSQNETQTFEITDIGVPTLSSPTNGSTDVSLTPTLKWDSYTGAVSYDLEVFIINSDATLTSKYSAPSVTEPQAVVPSGRLTSNNEYFWYVRANLSGTYTDWSKVWSFTTAIGCASPTIQTVAVSSVTNNSAHSGGDISSDGGCDITARGLCWSTSATPTTSNSHTTETGTTGTFSSTMTGLSSSTVYHVRAYATNSVGTSYGDELTFMTSPNHITNLVVRSVSRTFIAIQWSRGNGSGCMAVCLKGTSSDVVNPEYGTTDYSANSNYGSGDHLGTGTSSNYIVYKGTGNTLRVDGLTKNTQYTFKVYEYNLYNSYYSYATNSTPLSRNTSPKEGYDPEWADSPGSRLLSVRINPIPANEILNLALTLEETANITIELFNMEGQNVGTHCNMSLPVNSSYQKGQYEMPISIGNLASGSYYLVVSGNNELVIQDFVIDR